MVHHKTRFMSGDVVLRDIEDRDVDALVKYWHQSPPDFLRSLGVDLSKLKTPEETRQRFLDSVPRAADVSRSRITLVVEYERLLIAYANLNIRSVDEAYAHVHTLKKGLRAKAMAYLLFSATIKAFFNEAPVNRIVFQTSPENRDVNRLLQRFGMSPTLLHLDEPDGMARPGLFNVYEIGRKEAQHLSRMPARMMRNGSNEALR